MDRSHASSDLTARHVGGELAATWCPSSAAEQQIERLLGQTTSPAVTSQFWEQRDALLRDGQFEGKQVEATVLFTDTQDFTSISEQLSPTDLLTWLNRGMSLLVKEITNHGGIINKFTGDGVLAVFGAPISQGKAMNARRAIDAALDIADRLEQLNRELSAEQVHPCAFGSASIQAQ